MPRYSKVILGGGMVAGYAAQELVSLGVQGGQVAIISADNALPYERPPLSKGFLAGTEEEASVFINPPEFYREHGIEVRLEDPAVSVDPPGRRLSLMSGEDIEYEQLLIATGAQVRTFRSEGADLPGVLYLRSLTDSKQIRDAAKDARKAVVAGAGFIGMEVASVLAQQGIETTMTFPESRVWEALFTPEMSAFFQRYYEDRGVRFASGELVEGFEGQGRLSAVKLQSGGRLEADLVVAGIGVVPSTAIFDGSGLELDNGVVVNEYLETNVPGVYAAGDVANYWDVLFERRRRVEHWDNAVEQGKHAVALLQGDRKPFRHVPYFFSDVFDLSYEYWGDKSDADQAVHRGNVEDGSFSTWWLKDGRLVGAFVMNRPDEERDLAPGWIEQRKQLPADRLADASRPISELG